MSFRAIGVEVRSEEASSHGRADMVVEIGDQVFVIEFKMAEWAEAAGAAAVTKATEKALTTAFAQLRKRGYGNKYRGSGRKVHLIAVACGRGERNLLQVRTESQ